MSELLPHHFAVMSDRQIARQLLSLADFIGKNETGIAKEKSIALLVVAAARVESKKERLRKDIDDVKQLARKVAANAAEVARENQRLREMNEELQAALKKLYGYAAAAEISVSALDDALAAIRKATGHDPATPWEVTK